MREAAKGKESEAAKTNIEAYGFKKFFHIVWVLAGGCRSA